MDMRRARLLVERALVLQDDFADTQAALMLAQSSDPADRQKAAAAAFRTKLRVACDALVLLLREQGFQSQADLNLLMQLAPLAQSDLPVIEAMKAIGLQNAAAGNFEIAVRHLEQAQGRAAESSSRGTARARRAMNYLNDREIDQAYARLASMIQLSNRPAPSGERLKCFLIVSGIVDENPATPFALEVAKGIRESGVDVRVINTGFARAPGAAAAQDFERAGIVVDTVPAGTYAERLRFVADLFVSHGPHAAFYLVFPMDGLSKILECLSLAPAQLHNCVLYEPYCGVFEYVLFNNEVQLKTAHEPSKARYVGSGAFLRERIERASALGRTALGLPKDGILFGTSGRLAKCCGPYLDATIALLQAQGDALLAFAGPAYGNERDLLENAYRSAGVGDRVFFLGERQREIGGVLKTFDVYLDSFPEGGGQSIFEAMECGLPIVAMRDVYFPETGPEVHYSFAGERLGPAVEVAPPLDTDAYVRIALKYARMPEVRSRDGNAIRERARTAYDPRRAVAQMASLTREAAEKHWKPV